jgi:hypothetical protein
VADAVEVGANVGVRVGLGVNVNLGHGVIVFVGVSDAIDSDENSISCCSVGVPWSVDCGLVRINIETTKTITKTTPNKPIKNNCWGDILRSLSWRGSSE